MKEHHSREPIESLPIGDYAMKRHLRPVIGAFAVFLATCANPYHDFYRGVPLVPPNARTMPGVIPQEGPLQIFSTTDMKRDVREMRRHGWGGIGWASFNSGGDGITEGNLRAQADKVGAQAVLISSNYTGTVGGVMPLALPNNSTSYTSGSATAYGPGGTVNAYGNATTTTYGTTTTMVPYSVARYDYVVVFFVRTKQRLGLYPKALDDAERQKLQTNSAIGVDFVVDGSPAFNADILPGDYVLSLNGKPPGSLEEFYKRIKVLQGQDIDIVLLRNDQQITKRVHLNSY
jgi:hypothetical protein